MALRDLTYLPSFGIRWGPPQNTTVLPSAPAFPFAAASFSLSR